MSTGKVKEYDANQGCGIIINANGDQELTVYANYVNLKNDETLEKGQEVEFDIEKNRSGHWAINVRLLEKPVS